jgi:hypothetical protein
VSTETAIDPAPVLSRADDRPAGPEGDGSTRASPAPARDLPFADRRRLRRAWAVGAAPVIVVFGWLLMAERWAPFQRQFFDDFFDAQGRAFLDGRWDVPPETVGFEGFDVDGRTYIYFGPWPALLRIPVLLVTDRFDGRLTTLSMSLAMVVLAVAAHRLNVVVRTFVRGAVPVSRREAVATAVLAVAALSGPPLWLASSAVVYHEAILWGLAFTIAAMAEVVAWLDRPTRARLAAATALAGGAVLSRFTLGLGVVAGMAFLAAAAALRRRAAARRGRAVDVLGGFPLRWVACACVAVLVLSTIPNLARFGTLVSPPMDRQVASSMFSERQEFLAENRGAFFGLQFLPTTLLTYLRPDGVDPRVSFPWVDFPRAGPSVVGDATFDDLVWTSSAPATMPALATLAVPGLVWLVGAVRRRTRAAGLAAVCAGAAVGAAGALTIGHIANRYLNDLVPVALLLGLIGAHALAGWMPRWRPLRRRAVPVAVAALVAAGAWTTVGLGIVHQRERAAIVPEEWRAELFRWRVDLPGGSAPIITVPTSGWGHRLPEAADGTVAVAGDCLGMYVRVGETWNGVSRGPGVGVYDLRVDLDQLHDRPPWERVPLIVFGDDRDAGIVALRRLRDGRIRVDVDNAGSNGWIAGFPAELAGEVTIRVSIDPLAPSPAVTVGRTVLNDAGIGNLGARPSVGRLPTGVDRVGLADRYPGDVRRSRYDKDLCRDLVGTG